MESAAAVTWCMSKFKLDFDISTPARRLVPRVVSRCPPDVPKSRSNSQVSDPEDGTAPEARDTDRHTDGAVSAKDTHGASEERLEKKKNKKKKGTRIPVFAVQVFAVTVFLLFSAGWLAPQKKAPSIRVSRHDCVTQTNPVHSVVCLNHCRRLGHTECVVEFETAECADLLQSVHFHFADGRTRRVPAVYQRLSNSTMFAIEGDRAIFQPTRCRAHTSAVVVQSVTSNAKDKLRSHVVWIASDAYKKFRIVRNGASVLAEISADFVRDRCLPKASYCVYKLETRCEGHLSTQVVAVGDDGEEARVETFVYCD